MIYEKKFPIVSVLCDVAIPIVFLGWCSRKKVWQMILAGLLVSDVKVILLGVVIIGLVVWQIVSICKEISKHQNMKKIGMAQTNLIRSEREILCGSYADEVTFSETIEDFGMLYLTWHGLEYYSRKGNFFIPFQDIIKIKKSNEFLSKKDIEITTTQEHYVVHTQGEDIAMAYEACFNKMRAALGYAAPTGANGETIAQVQMPQQQIQQPQMPPRQAGYQQPAPPQASYPNQQVWGYQYPNQAQVPPQTYAPNYQQPYPAYPSQQPIAYPYPEQQAGAYPSNNTANQQNGNG